MQIRQYPRYQTLPQIRKSSFLPEAAPASYGQAFITQSRPTKPHFGLGPIGTVNEGEDKQHAIQAAKTGNVYTLQEIARGGRRPYVRYEYGQPVTNYIEWQTNFSNIHEAGDNLQLIAARHGHLNVMQWLAANGGVSPWIRYSHLAPIHEAAAHGHINILDWLHRTRGVNLELKDSENRTALHHAIMNGQEASVDWLLKHNVDVLTSHSSTSWGTPLEIARRSGNAKIIHMVEQAVKQAKDSKKSKPQIFIENVITKTFSTSSSSSSPENTKKLDDSKKRIKELEKEKKELESQKKTLSSTSQKELENLRNTVQTLESSGSTLQESLKAQQRKTQKYMQRTYNLGGHISSEDEADGDTALIQKKKRESSVDRIKRAYQVLKQQASARNISLSSDDDEPERGRTRNRQNPTNRSYSRSPSQGTLNWVFSYLAKKNNAGLLTGQPNRRASSTDSNKSTTSSILKGASKAKSLVVDTIYVNTIWLKDKLLTGTSWGSSSLLSNMNDRITKLEAVRDFTEETILHGIRESKKEERRKLLFNKSLFTAGLAGLAIGIPLIIFLPPVGAAFTALGGAMSATAAVPLVKGLGGIALDIASNEQFMPESKYKVERWTEKFKDTIPGLPGSKNVDKKTQKYIKQLHDAADQLTRDINRAKNGPEALKAIQEFLATVGKRNLDHIANHGDRDQKAELDVLRKFGKQYQDLTQQLPAKPTDEDLDAYGRELQKLAAQLNDLPGYTKLIEALQSKNVSDLSQRKPGKMSISELFGDDLKTDFQQQSKTTCHLLAPLDSILNYSKPEAKEILSRIKCERIKGGFKVAFPACTAIVSDEQLRGLNVVQSKFPGPRIIEQACKNLLDDPNEFNDPTTVLSKIFFNAKTPPSYADITIQATSKRDARPIEAQFFNGGFHFWKDGDRKLLTLDKLIERDRQKLLDEIQRVEQQPGGGAGQKLYLEQPGAGFTGSGEYKIAEPDQKLGDKGFFYHQRKDELRTYIRKIKECTEENRPLDILTAVRADKTDGTDKAHVKHYYSVRILESDENRIVLADPYDTSGTDFTRPKRAIPIDEFLNKYHLQGIRLSRVTNESESSESFLNSFKLFQ